jgi:hypothetical protein
MWLLEDKAMFSEEQRKAASERAKARWADPEYKERLRKALSSSPRCPFCNETNIEKFYVDKNGNRTNSYCRECHKKGCKERWHKRPWLDRWSSRNYLYGVTKEFLIDLHEKQKGKCAICNEEPKTVRGLHIDHCHKTGKVRGLLCHGCNVALGSFKEDVTLLNKAIEYIRSF